MSWRNAGGDGGLKILLSDDEFIRNAYHENYILYENSREPKTALSKHPDKLDFPN